MKITTLSIIAFLFCFSLNAHSQCGMTITPSANNITCNANCDGMASASVTGGTGPYTYLWNDPGAQSTASASGLCSGTYIVTVTDAVPCTQTETVTITEPALLSVSTYSVTNASCGNCNGFAGAQPTGGTPGYTFMWSNGSTGSSANGLCAGTYTVMITDANGCTASTIFSITQGGGQTPVATLTPTLPSSCAVCDGSLSASASGGTPPYTYVWSPGGQTTSSISGLCSGFYTLSVTDVNGCWSATTHTLTAVNNTTVTGTVTNASCSDGSIDITVSNGAPPYTYLWNVGATTEDISNLPPGNYSVTVTGMGGCSATAFFTVTQGPPDGSCSQITGKVYYDANADCVFNGTDIGLSSVIITAAPGPYYSVTNSSGDYSMIVPPGTYTVKHTLPANWGELCPGSGYSSVVANAASTTPNIDFADTIPSLFDLRVWAYTGGAVPGFSRSYYLWYNNLGNTPMNGTVYLVIDPLDNFTSASVAPSSISGDTLFWNFTNLLPTQYVWINIFCSNLPANPALLGDTIFYCAKILPIAGDINPVDNTSCGYRVITGSYDPNEKEVFPEGTGATGDILQSDTILTYTIHFQNTGTGPAQTVVVRDTLSQYLNPATVESGPSSHAYTFSMSGNGILKWTFNNIMLPDSGSNLAGSNGYITFKIHLKPNLPIGTVITNEADIYFDFNPPITTNAVINTISNPNSLNEVIKNSSLKIFPNPTTGIFQITSGELRITNIEIVNVLGEKVTRSVIPSGVRNLTIDLSAQPSGVYFFRATTPEGAVVKKIIRQ